MSLRRLAENLGFFKALAYRFFPPYQLWFVLTRRADTRDWWGCRDGASVTVVWLEWVRRREPALDGLANRIEQ